MSSKFTPEEREMIEEFRQEVLHLLDYLQSRKFLSNPTKACAVMGAAITALLRTPELKQDFLNTLTEHMDLSKKRGYDA
jgi:hypothetical protein